MSQTASYRLVTLRNGVSAVFAAAYDEAMHPGDGPAAEAEWLYVDQLKLRERLKRHAGDFIVWDIGLGAGANAAAVLRATRECLCPLHLVSFDNTLEPLAFALEHTTVLGYLRDYEAVAGKVLQKHAVEFMDGRRTVRWETVVQDFPAFLAGGAAANFPTPDAILFDAFSPARNAAMWTLPVFDKLFRLLDPHRPCGLTTYSRSTMVRVTMLLAGFFVGRGRPSGAKEETTVAANALELLDDPLEAGWLQRAKKSGSAEPLRDAGYRQAPLAPETWARLVAHPQFHQ